MEAIFLQNSLYFIRIFFNISDLLLWKGNRSFFTKKHLHFYTFKKDALLVQPLNYNRETQLEGALAAFYAPTRTLSDLVVMEYRDHVLRYARRFFHHLLRHRRLQKAFLLANDIGAQDLFLDVHHMALHFKVFFKEWSARFEL
jgi:hypothetical protein